MNFFRLDIIFGFFGYRNGAFWKDLLREEIILH